MKVDSKAAPEAEVIDEPFDWSFDDGSLPSFEQGIAVLDAANPLMPGKKEASDEEIESEVAEMMGGSEDEGDVEQAAAGAEAEAAGAEPVVKPEPPAYDIMADIRKRLPDAVIEKPEEIAEYLETLRTERLQYAPLDELGSTNEAWLNFTKRLLAGEPVWKAAMEVFTGVLKAPDQDEDPAGYDEWVRRQEIMDAERRVAEKYEREKEQTTLASRQVREKETARQFEALAAENKWDAEQAEKEGAAIAALINGDPVTKRVRGDLIRRLHFAVRMDDILAEKEAEAEKRGYTKAMQDVKAKNKAVRTGPSLESTGEIAESSPEAKKMQNLMDSLGISGGGEKSWYDRL